MFCWNFGNKMIRLKIIFDPLLLTMMQKMDRFIFHLKQQKIGENLWNNGFQDTSYQATKDSDSTKGKQMRHALWFLQLTASREFLSCAAGTGSPCGAWGTPWVEENCLRDQETVARVHGAGHWRKLSRDSTPEICRGAPSSSQQSTGQCMQIRKQPKAGGRITERIRDNCDHWVGGKLVPFPTSQTGKHHSSCSTR